MKDPLFPEIPEDLSGLSDEELATMLEQHRNAAELIDANDEEFLKGASAEDVLSEYERGVAQIDAIKAEQDARAEAAAAYEEKKAELSARALGAAEDEPAPDDPSEPEPDDPDDPSDEAAAELAAETETVEDESAEVEEVEEPVAVAAAAAPPAPAAPPARRMIRPPAPKPERLPAEQGAMLTAAGGVEGARPGEGLDRKRYATAVSKTAQRHGKPSKNEYGVETRILIAAAHFEFPEDRILGDDAARNAELIRSVIPASVPGMEGLVASGGLCAPLTPLYTMPNFASQARPVRDALPSFQASRGGVNVPAATYIGDIDSAITVIEESEDALGGTFATKSCQDLECPAYTETAVTIISHCREYGNLNAMAWPEKIAHENDLTMAAHARSAETYLLDRIKAQSVNVTQGADTLSALTYLIDAIVKARFGIKTRLRMADDARFRALIPSWVPDMLLLDTVSTIDGNRFTSRAQIISYLRDAGIEPTFYLDSPSTGTSQIADAAQTAAALDGLPANVQWAIYPEGAFIHVDSGTLELGIVRDSTLNSTNDFQLFGESFENVARLAPEQAAYWVTSNLCPVGTFPPAGTARTCE